MGNWEQVLNVLTTQRLPAGRHCANWSFCLWLAGTSEFWRVESGEIVSCFDLACGFKMFRHILEGSIIIASIIYFYRKNAMFAAQLLLVTLAWSLIARCWECPECCFGGLKAWHECSHFCHLKMCHTIHNAILCHTAPSSTDKKQNLRSWLYEYELDSAKSLDFSSYWAEAKKPMGLCHLLSQMLHVWYLHLPPKLPKCR